MSIALAVFLFAIGLLLTVKGSDVFVDSATRVATSARIPKFIIGATLVSIATTLPLKSCSLTDIGTCKEKQPVTGSSSISINLP